MKRAMIITVLVLSGGVLYAQGVNEIPCWVLGSGRAVLNGPSHSVPCVLGQPVVGTSYSPNHSIRHGYTGCSVTVTAAPGGQSSATPAVYALHQNVPNPFNPQTVIRYDVPAKPGQVAIRIYDVSGRRVRTLVDRRDSPGRHEIVWNGTDDGGRSVASGLYIVVLETPQGSFNRKMALIR